MALPRIALPPLPWRGGCQCGGVRYSISERPLTLYACHCTECQTQSSSAFGMSMRLNVDAVRIEGETKSWLRGMGTGVQVEGVFCPSCGCRIYHARPGANTLNIKPGTLDNASWLQPVGYLWTVSKHAGVILHPDLPSYERQPESFDDLIEAWRIACGGGNG